MHMPDYNNDGIITVDEIEQELQEYYSKPVMTNILDGKLDKGEAYTKKEIDKKLADLVLNGGGGGSITLDDYYTKDEVKSILKTLKMAKVKIDVEVTTDNQTEFTIPTIDTGVETILIFNTTLREDYTVSGNTLTTDFEVPMNAKLTLIALSVSVTL